MKKLIDTIMLFFERMLYDSRPLDPMYDHEPSADDADAVAMYETRPRQIKTLFISAGHSDADSGAVGNGYTEAAIVTEFRDLVAEILRGRGIRFTKDGVAGKNLPLRDAIALAKKHDVAIEWHCNAFTSQKATGTETLCDSPGNSLSMALCDVTANVLGIPNRGSKAQSSGQHSRLGFIATGRGIIHELFFITNQHDLKSYLQHRHELARQVADVLEAHVCD